MPISFWLAVSLLAAYPLVGAGTTVEDQYHMNSRTVIDRIQNWDDNRVFFFSRLMKTGSSSIISTLQIHETELHSGKGRCNLPSIFIEPNFGAKCRPGQIQCTFKSSSNPEFVDWKDISTARNRFGDLWIYSHSLYFGKAQEIAKVHIPTGMQICYVTIIRSPFNWIRSLYAHGHKITGVGRSDRENITEWFAGYGLRYMGDHYPMALPDEMRNQFIIWLKKSREKTDKVAIESTKDLFPLPANDAVKEFANNLDFMAMLRHLRNHYLILLTEYHSLSTSLLSVALCGRNTSLHEKHMLRNKDTRSAAFDRFSFRAETLSAITPILAPFEALYGVYSTIFFEDVARYL